jgi:disulfide oxidoreductase YuzD
MTKTTSLSKCLLLAFSLLATATVFSQNINYTISLTKVDWTGNFDANNREEYGLVMPTGVSGCASAVNAPNAGTWNGSIIVADALNVPPNSTFSGTFIGIENDPNTEDPATFCARDGNDDLICNVSVSINLSTVSNGSTVTFSCNRTAAPIGSVTLTFTIVKSLPVSLERFTGKAEGKTVRLEWSTSAELNNDYFDVEHSADGQNFRSLAQINGKGTTALRSKYEYLHANAAPGTNYYRLKQVDNDGSSEVFKVITVNVNGVNNGTLLVFPNPATDRLLVDAGDDYDASKFWAINAAGQRIVLEGQSQNGRFELQLPANLPAGMYWLIKESAKGVQKAAFVKE